MKIVFQSSDCVVIDKPSGWLSVPSRMGTQELRPIAGIELQKTFQQQVWPVHRLDCEVSGLLVFALNAKAHRKLNSAFENRKVKKIYEALSFSVPPDSRDKLIWKSILLKGKKRAYEHAAGKLAETHGFAVSLQGRFGYWLLAPITGRSHQLRFEMMKHHYPIIGDQLYGSQIAWEKNGIALRSSVLEIPALDLDIPQKLTVSSLLDEPVARNQLAGAELQQWPTLNREVLIENIRL